MNFLKGIPYLVAALTIFVGCSDNFTNPSDNNDVVMPLKVGNQWIFRTYLTDTTGTMIDEHYDTLTVRGAQVFKNALWYDMSGDGTYYLANRTDGLWRRDYGSTMEHIAKMPGQRGDKYTALYYTNPNNDSIVSGLSMYRIVATDTVISTPAGTFTCYAYTDVSSDPHRYDNIWFYSEGVGFIKETAISRFNKENWGSELVSYTLK